MIAQLSIFEKNKPALTEYLRRQARHLCNKYGSVTADTLRDFVGESLPTWCDKRIVGSVLASKDFKAVDFVKTKRSTSHGRLIRRFRLRRTK